MKVSSMGRTLLLLVLCSSCASLSFSKEMGYAAYFSTEEQKNIIRSIERNEPSLLTELIKNNPEKLDFSGDRWVTPLVVAVAAGNDYAFDQLLQVGLFEKLVKKEKQRLLTGAAYAKNLHYLATLLKRISDLDALFEGEIGFVSGLVLEELNQDRFREIVRLGYSEASLSAALTTAVYSYEWDYILILLEEGANPNFGKYLKKNLTDTIKKVLGKNPDSEIRDKIGQVVKILNAKYSFGLES